MQSTNGMDHLLVVVTPKIKHSQNISYYATKPFIISNIVDDMRWLYAKL